MIDHLSFYATDYTATRNFYVACLGALGYEIQTESEIAQDPDLPNRKICAFGPSGKTLFWVVEVKSASSPRHLAFSADDRKAVTAFHSAALATGGIDHGAPGLRSEYHEHYYGAFVLDPEGNNVEACCHESGIER
jgi:catechol 2,3-dioxygenase-like lactoylglutathione lyase family enzyme